jgi:hypothetical protein
MIRVYRELKTLTPPAINEPIKKCTTELNRTFSKKTFKCPKSTRKNAHHL